MFDVIVVTFMHGWVWMKIWGTRVRIEWDYTAI